MSAGPGCQNVQYCIHSRFATLSVHSQSVVLPIYLNTRQKFKSNLGLLLYPPSPKSNHLVLMILRLHVLRETAPFSPILPQIPSFRPAAFLTLNIRNAYKVLVNFTLYFALEQAN